MATHDPILALMGDRRVIINNGAMQNVIEPSDQEKATSPNYGLWMPS